MEINGRTECETAKNLYFNSFGGYLHLSEFVLRGLQTYQRTGVGRRIKSKRLDYEEHDCSEDMNVSPANTLDRHLQDRLASPREVAMRDW